MEKIEIIERFFEQEHNIFNLSDAIFTDLCIEVEENHKDVVLADRIELYFQNYSLCNTGCIISEINMGNMNIYVKSHIIVLYLIMTTIMEKHIM